MVRCDICHLGQARFVCRECGSRLCNQCFDSSTDLCVVCKAPYVQRTRTSSLVGLVVPLGIALIFVGIVLMMVGALMSTEPGEGLVILFPFLIGSVESTTVLLAFLLVLIFIVLILFLPWILSPRRIWRMLSRAMCRKPWRQFSTYE